MPSDREILERAVAAISREASNTSDLIDEGMGTLPADHPVTIAAKMLRLELLKTKAELERGQRSSASPAPTAVGTSTGWSAWGTRRVTGRTPNRRHTVSRQGARKLRSRRTASGLTSRVATRPMIRTMRVQASVVQAAAIGFDREQTMDKLEQLIAEAAGGGAQLAVFPEALVPAYPKGIVFGTVVGQRTPEGRDQFRRYFDGAIDVPGPEVDRIATAALEHAIHLVVGVIERDGGTLYDDALFFSPEGYLGKHRKLMPTGAERLIWGFGDGSTLPVFDTSLGRLGAAICWENNMPMLRMAMYSKGIQIYCMPTSDSRETWLPTMRHVAL